MARLPKMTDTAESERIDYTEVAPELYQAYLALETLLRRTALERTLVELVKLRASQINGCAYCLDLHGRAAIRAGEEPRRLFQLAGWAESPAFTPRERAALAWTEAVTRLSEPHVPAELYRATREQFNDRELVELTWLVVAINGWNRIAISFRTPPEAPEIAGPSAPGSTRAR